MMRAIHFRAPNRTSIMLLGTSTRMYPMKNSPAARPIWPAVMFRSRDIGAAT
jgi:hypothetical protein